MPIDGDWLVTIVVIFAVLVGVVFLTWAMNGATSAVVESTYDAECRMLGYDRADLDGPLWKYYVYCVRTVTTTEEEPLSVLRKREG